MILIHVNYEILKNKSMSYYFIYSNGWPTLHLADNMLVYSVMQIHNLYSEILAAEGKQMINGLLSSA